jgi:hypothetical protein
MQWFLSIGAGRVRVARPRGDEADHDHVYLEAR